MTPKETDLTIPKSLIGKLSVLVAKGETNKATKLYLKDGGAFCLLDLLKLASYATVNFNYEFKNLLAADLDDLFSAGFELTDDYNHIYVLRELAEICDRNPKITAQLIRNHQDSRFAKHLVPMLSYETYEQLNEYDILVDPCPRCECAISGHCLLRKNNSCPHQKLFTSYLQKQTANKG